MGRWKIRVHDAEGRARIMLELDGQSVGMINVSWIAYRKLSSDIMMFLRDQLGESLAKNLAALLWADAQRMSEESSELAMLKLKSFGWNEEKVDQYARQLAILFAQGILGFLPEHE